jgi:hypothetical protein
MAGGMALSGVLYAELGDRAYAVMALTAALGGVFVLLARSWVTQSRSDSGILHRSNARLHRRAFWNYQSVGVSRMPSYPIKRP